MKKALDGANLRDALKYSSIMLSELKTSLLSPKNYYVLYMQIFDEMRVLEGYFKEEGRRGRKMIDLYESVQHATNPPTLSFNNSGICIYSDSRGKFNLIKSRSEPRRFFKI